MPQRLLTSLTWKAGVAIAATALAAGTGATTFHLVNDSHPSDDPAEISEHGSTTTTTSTTVDGSTTSTTADDHGADANTAGDQPDHPDNFGATVSEDAHDGGVDGQEISDMAHARNDARKAGTDHATADDQKSDDEQGEDSADDEGGEHRAEAGTQHGQDDTHQDNGTDD